MIDLDRLSTEQRNPASVAIDKVSTQEMMEIINREDHKVADAVEKILPAIALAVDLVADRLSRGGRLFYMGSGTSGPGSTVRHRSASFAMADCRLQQSPNTAQPRSRASFMPPNT